MSPKTKWKTTPDRRGGASGPCVPGGPGRPTPGPNKVRCSFKLAPDVIGILNDIRASGTAKAVAIETAIRAMYGPESKAGKDAVSRVRESSEIIILTRSRIRYGAPEARKEA